METTETSLLILNVGLRFEQMGKRTGAYEPVFSNDIEMFRPGKIEQFDALCFLNTVGVLFDDPEVTRALGVFTRADLCRIWSDSVYEPMRDELLWIYEGLTQYYGVVLAARSGAWKPEAFHEYLAATFARLDARPGRTWRDLEDTAISSQLLYSAREAGSTWRRPVDYYEESELVWLDADTLIREKTAGKKSLDDFCRAFHGGESGAPKLIPYTLDDVVARLNAIAPYDWNKFFEERIHSRGPGAPLEGLKRSGWKIAFNATPNEHVKSEEEAGHVFNAEFSLGFAVHAAGLDNADEVGEVVWGSPAAKAGMAAGMKLVAVNGRKWSADIFREAIRAAKDGKGPIELLVENDEFYQTVKIDWHEGERYPHLLATSGPDILSEIAKKHAAAVSAGK